MGVPIALRALDPYWLRFTDPEDQGKYGEAWLKYDEGAILRMRARDQIALETELGMPLVAVMNGGRQSSVLGDTAIAWLALHAVDPARAGDFDEFNPVTMLIEYTATDPEPGPKEPEAEPASPPSVEPVLPMDSSSPSSNSAPTATVALPAMPVAE